MVDRAKQLQRNQGLRNVSWHVGTACPLPFPDQSYSLVVCRYAFHHFAQPRDVLQEMVRVCRGGGSVAVVDVAPTAEKRDRFDAVERLKDPSHCRAITLDEFIALAGAAGLREIRTRSFALPMRLSRQLKAALTPPQIEHIRSTYMADLGKDELGVGVHLDGDEVCFSYPSILLTGTAEGG
jgi:SAM-dependent methyltransferase